MSRQENQGLGRQAHPPPLLLPMLPGGDGEALVHVSVQQPQDVAANQVPCEDETRSGSAVLLSGSWTVHLVRSSMFLENQESSKACVPGHISERDGSTCLLLLGLNPRVSDIPTGNTTSTL